MSHFSRTLRRAAQHEWQFLQQSLWDRALVSWIPLLLLGLMAALFWQPVLRSLPVAVVDMSHGNVSRAITRALNSTPAVEIVAQPADLQAAWELVQSNQVHALLYLPAATDKSIIANQPATIFAFYNANFAAAGSTALREIEAAVNYISTDVVLEYTAASLGPQVLKPAPIRAQVQVLFNPARNFEQFLLGLIFPGLLHLILCVAVTSAYVREIRDATLGQWLACLDGRLAPALLGKALPYVALFSLYGVAALVWLTLVRGDGIAGSWWRLITANVLLFAAYAAVGLVFAGITRNMANALSAVGLYAGTSLAFCGATFPIDGAPLFARIWHHLLPFSSYIKLDAAERYMQASASVSLYYLAALGIFVLVLSLLGYGLYLRCVNEPESWGQR